MIQPGANSLHAAIDGFLRSLKIERNCSDLTIKSYSEDLNSLLNCGEVPALFGKQERADAAEKIRDSVVLDH